ncbi:hypothetical protein GCM10010211_63240 [Streptomyces albospinus]|uniref:Uncharacterized protein n=1 Tax=Streptomyces albospinus TaxID=285515 RepID=A0ABQ2VLA1_9ACTN|nr:hypothetical protein GCM10010211_63240 [Streptomyces albospinus]
MLTPGPTPPPQGGELPYEVPLKPLPRLPPKHLILTTDPELHPSPPTHTSPPPTVSPHHPREGTGRRGGVSGRKAQQSGHPAPEARHRTPTAPRSG